TRRRVCSALHRRRLGSPPKRARSKGGILCRMVRGSSADQRSANRRLSASFIARGKTQITPRDRIQNSKTSSLQSHRRMGVMKQDCSRSRKIAADGEDAARRTRQRGQDIPAGSNRSLFRNIRSATAIAARLADPECSSPEGGDEDV